MSRSHLFRWLSSATGYIGIGMLLGYALGDKTNNTPLWIGILLILCGALLLGMFISSRGDHRVRVDSERATPPPEPDVRG